MGHLAVWKALEEMTARLREKGVAVPAEVVADLKNAKTLIKILKADPTRGETLQKIDECLLNVESYLVSEATKRFGSEYVEEWLKRVDDAGRKTPDEEEEKRFVPGLPRQQDWIRITPPADLPLERLEALAEESNLCCSTQQDGSLIVYGKGKTVKDFIKKIATKYKLKTEK